MHGVGKIEEKLVRNLDHHRQWPQGIRELRGPRMGQALSTGRTGAREKGILKGMRTRFHSALVILIAGILFMIGVLTEGTQAVVGKYIYEISPVLAVYFNGTVNYLFSIMIVTVWFAMVFRYLPDGRPGWRIAFSGAFLTSILFTIGKIILHWLLSYSNINTLYGTSASIVLLLLFVFYSSLILYFGAAFTKIWGIYKDEPIRPLPHATHYRLVESEIE